MSEEELDEGVPGIGRARFPQVNQLFEITVTPDKRSQDAKCLGCGQVRKSVKFDRLIKHSTVCMQSDRTLVRSLMDNIEEFKRKKAEKNINTAERVQRVELQAQVDELLVRFIASKSLPLSIVESRGLKNLMSKMEKSYQLPTRKKLTYKLLPQVAKMCHEKALFQLRKSEDYSLSVEIDGWTSIGGNSILAVVITTQSGASMLLDLVDISHVSHSGEMLADITITAMRESSIPKAKFNAILSDEASNCRKAREFVVDKFPGHSLIQYRCMAHVFNLVGALMSKSGPMKGPLEKLLSLINIIGRSKLLSSKLKEAGANKLINTVPTRWYSTCAAINSVLKARSALESIPKTRNFAYSKWGPTIEDSGFWSALEGFKSYFDRLASMIGRAEARDSLLSNSFRDLLEFIKFISEKSSQDQYREIALQAVIYHFTKLDVSLLLASYIINPNYGSEYLTAKAVGRAKEYLVKTLFDMNGADEKAAETMMSEFTIYSGLTDGSLPPVDNAHIWWNRSRFPVLGIVGRRLLSLHGSSANTERLFSALNSIATPKRNLISCSTMSDLISVNLYESSLPLEQDELPHALSEQSRGIASQVASQQGDPSRANSDFDRVVNEEPGAYLFDPDLLDDAGNPAMTSAFYSCVEYLEFKSLVNFDLTRQATSSTQGEETAAEGTRRSSDELARRFMSRFL